MGRIPVIPACNKSEWKTNKPIATSTTANGKMDQNNSNENSVTAFVIGTGPVSVMVNSRSSHVHISAVAGVPSGLNSQGRGVLLMLSRSSWVFSMISFAGLSSVTAIAIIARSSFPSGTSSAPSLISRANLSRPGVGVPSSSYISLMIKSMVC